MKIRTTLTLLTLFTLFLTACGGTTPPAAETLTATAPPPVMKPTVLPTFTSEPFGSPIPFPTLSNLPSPTIAPTQTPLPAVLPKFPLDGYVMLFTKDGDLYFQDGENTPVKLAHIEGNVYPPYFTLLSSDNRKVVFYQDDGNIYSLNTDGTQEQVIIPSNWSAALESGTFMGVLDFVPKSHVVFFEAMLCKEESSVSLCSTTIFLVDADTGETKKLADLGMALQNHMPDIQNNIRFSPDGKMMAVGTMEGIRIFALDGKIIRENILPFKPSKSEAPFPSLFWLPDSSGLIAALPNALYDSGGWGKLTAYAIWRYKLGDNSSIQIPLAPPVSEVFEVSPNGNWIVYYGGIKSTPELYLGNLVDESVRDFTSDISKQRLSWSLNSKYFIWGWEVVIAIDKPPLDGGPGPRWVDSNHFIYVDLPISNPAIQERRILVAEIKGNEVYYYELGFLYPIFPNIKAKQ